jgi:mycothiol synthase
MSHVDLPDGLSQRPLRVDDAAAVTAVMSAQELHDLGEVVIEEADIVGDWQRPSFDVGASTVGVFDGDALVAYAEVSLEDRGDAAVHPDYRRRGIGTALAGWMQQRARDKGSTVIGMPVPSGSPGEELLTALGYRVRWNSWVLGLPEGKAIEAQPLPDGYTIGTAESEEARRAVWTVVEDAFLEWSVRDRQTFEDFAAQVWQRPGYEPWSLRYVADADGTIVGASLVLLADGCGYIDKLAVRRDLRGRGLARALLADSFREAREHGATRSELSTDSRTGALGLYNKVGMEIRSHWVNLAIDL